MNVFLLQTVFEEWGKKIKEGIANTDPVMVWAWIFLISGLIVGFLLVFFTEFKRTERESVKFSLITAVFVSILLGLGIEFMLTAYGYW
jgi:hypothetical protein